MKNTTISSKIGHFDPDFAQGKPRILPPGESINREIFRKNRLSQGDLPV